MSSERKPIKHTLIVSLDEETGRIGVNPGSTYQLDALGTLGLLTAAQFEVAHSLEVDPEAE